MIKLFQFYVHWPLLNKISISNVLPLFCITFLSDCGMERASSIKLASSMFLQACLNLDFRSPIVLGIESLYAAASSVMFQRFSMGLRSGIFSGHSSVFDKIREAFRAPLQGCFRRRMRWCAIVYEGHTVFVHEKFRFAGPSVADLRLHFFLKDFCDMRNKT